MTLDNDIHISPSLTSQSDRSPVHKGKELTWTGHFHYCRLQKAENHHKGFSHDFTHACLSSAGRLIKEKKLMENNKKKRQRKGKQTVQSTLFPTKRALF